VGRKGVFYLFIRRISAYAAHIEDGRGSQLPVGCIYAVQSRNEVSRSMAYRCIRILIQTQVFFSKAKI
jgi:hypothetical protein